LERCNLKGSDTKGTEGRRVFYKKLNSVFHFVIPALISFIFLSCDKQPIIEIADTVSGKIYGRQILNGTDEFAVEFIHSVNNSAVREIYKAEGKKIKSAAVRFYSFGAGMQTELEDGLTMTRDGDAYIISGFNRTFTELNYIVGTVSDHLLIIGDDYISLRDLCGKNAHVTLRIK